MQATSKKPNSIKFPDEVQGDLQRIMQRLGEKSGRRVTMTSVVVAAIKYGIPLLERDIDIDLELPSSTMPESERLVYVASQIFQKGLQALGLSTTPSPSQT